jgi:hypothetical protein
MVFGHTVDHGKLSFGQIRLGAGSVISSSSNVQPGAVVGRRTTVGALSLVLKGEVLPDNTYWAGSPAVCLREHPDGDRTATRGGLRLVATSHGNVTRGGGAKHTTYALLVGCAIGALFRVYGAHMCFAADTISQVQWQCGPILWSHRLGFEWATPCGADFFWLCEASVFGWYMLQTVGATVLWLSFCFCYTAARKSARSTRSILPETQPLLKQQRS